MHPQPPPGSDHAAGQLANPGYWLGSGLEWPGGHDGWAEAAVAVAPGMIPRSQLSSDACQVLGCADLYAARHGLRVVFFSDLTRVFTTAGTSWAELGVDWEAALAEFCDGPHPAMYLTISYRAYLHICDSAAHMIIYGSCGAVAGARKRAIPSVTGTGPVPAAGAELNTNSCKS